MAKDRETLGTAFANLFTANISSSLGDGIARTAIPLLAVQLTDDALAISVISALVLLPWLLFALPAGMLVDRIDRRLALGLANTVRTLLAVLLLVLTATGNLTLWWIYIIVFLYGAFETVYDGAIRAVVPSVVPRRLLPRANGRIEAGEQVIQNFVAGPITSWFFAFAVLVPLAANVAVLILAVVLAFLLPKAASGRQFAAAAVVGEKPMPFRQQLVEGWRFIIGNRMLRKLWVLSTIDGLLFSLANASFVLYLISRLGLPEAWFGTFLLTGAIAAIVASFVVQPFKARFGAGVTMALGSVFAAAGLIVVWLWQDLWGAGVGFFLSSFGVTMWNVLVMSLRQAVIPGRLLGRVHGTWRTVLWGTMPVGSIIGGLIGRIDLALPFLVGGVLSLVTSILFFRFFASLPNPEDVDNGDPVTPDTSAGPTDPGLVD